MIMTIFWRPRQGRFTSLINGHDGAQAEHKSFCHEGIVADGDPFYF